MGLAATAAARRSRVSVGRGRAFGVFFLLLAAVMAVLFGGGTKAGLVAHFGFDLSTGAHVPPLGVPVRATVFVLSAVCAFVGAVQLSRGFGRHTYLVLGSVVALFVFAFLAWAGRDQSVNFSGLLQSTLIRSVPLTLGALSGVLCERAAVINVAIEGQFLLSAFTGTIVASGTHSTWLGLIGGVAMGGLLGAVLAVLSIKYLADQIIVGVVLDVFALGMTGFLTDRLLVPYQSTLNTPSTFDPIAIPGLSKIPLIGPILFNENIIVYAMFVLVVVIHIALFRTAWGLHVRAVGEHPRAADTVGIKVLRTRYRNVIYGGMVAGLGGAFFTLGSVGQFSKNMTSGQGFIALAAMIFGRWSPIGAFAASLVFGFADALQNVLSLLQVPVPSQVLLMTPYIVTILVVAGVVGRARPPAADGKPYIKN